MGRVFSLTQRTGRAVGFRVFGSSMHVTFTVVLSIILARILPPEEFGLFGVTVSVIAIAQVLGSCGMLQALVQRKDIVPEHETAAITFQLVTAVSLSTVLFCWAPAIEALFGMAGLAMIIRVQAGSLLFQAVSVLPETRLHRQLAFDCLAVIQIAGKVVGGGVTIFLATQGFGAMALAIGSLVDAMANALLLWVYAPGFLPLKFRLQHFHELFSYGSGILLINIMNILARRADTLIIGRQVGSEAVGLYHRANQIVLLPLSQVTGPVNKVLFAAMSSVQEEQARFLRGYLGSVRSSSLVAFPLLTMLWVAADIIVPVLYGPMWEGTVPILQILAVSGIFRILSNTSGLVVQARGQAMAEARRQAIWLSLVVVFGLLGSYVGALGVAIGIALATFIFFISMTRLALSIAGARFVELLKAMQTGILGSVAMAVAILIIKNIFVAYLPGILLLAMIFCSGLLAYLATIRFCFTREDSKFLDSVFRILPSYLESICRLMFRVPSGRLIQRFEGEIPA